MTTTNQFLSIWLKVVAGMVIGGGTIALLALIPQWSMAWFGDWGLTASVFVEGSALLAAWIMFRAGTRASNT